MPSFQIKVLISAVVLFAFSTFIYVYLVKNKESRKRWPPNIGMCPDYWNISNDKTTCVASQYNLGKLAVIEPIPIVTYDIRTPKGRYEIATWTTDNEIMWDGITNV
jgi:hypothetical protein